MTIDACTCCCVAKAGRLMSKECTAFTRSWVRSGTKSQKRRVRPKLREERAQALIPTTSDFVHDQLATGRGIRILTVAGTFSRFSSQSIRASATRAGCRGHTGQGMPNQGYPKTIGSTRASSSSPATSIYGPIDAASSWISRDQASRPAMPSSSRQRQIPGGVPEHTLVSEP